jgi:RNA polymerase sigma factor (sigma-70 family)
MSTKDIRITVTVRNGAMLRAMEAAGIDSAAELARKAAVTYQIVINYLGLKFAPYDKNDQLRASIVRIAGVLGRDPDSLFPEPFLRRALEKNKASRDVSADDLPQLLGAPTHTALSYDPEESAAVQEAAETLMAAVSTLKPRHQQALRMRYGLDGEREHSLAEIAKKLGVGVERVRQMVANSERQLRHPSKMNPRAVRALLS